MTDRRRKLAALDWMVAMGADEAVGETPVDRRRAAPPEPAPAPSPEPAGAPATRREPGPDAPLAPAQGAVAAFPVGAQELSEVFHRQRSSEGGSLARINAG